jgi:hypothetical protein
VLSDGWVFVDDGRSTVSDREVVFKGLEVVSKLDRIVDEIGEAYIEKVP